MSLSENVDYELIPDTSESKETWHIRLMTGEFVETVFQFDKISVGRDHLKFNFNLISTPDGDLNEDNASLQQHVGMVLYSIIENSLEDVE